MKNKLREIAESKGREFWIFNKEIGTWNSPVLVSKPEHLSSFTHVIEKSEYDKLAAALKVACDVIYLQSEALAHIKEQGRSAINRRHMLGEVDDTFDFVVSKIEMDCDKALAAAEKMLGDV